MKNTLRPTLLFLLPLAGFACGAPPAPQTPARAVTTTSGGDGDQRLADLGTCALESGEKIEGCKIGFRTFGKLDATKSNAVLFPTWFTGTTKSLLDGVPNKLVDTSRFYLILVDAIGDGVSTSPSNSATQPRLRFPKFTIRDMVESQRRLLREALGVEKLHAVMGISMGGMQALEWSVAHPDEVARVVPIVGTPQLSSQDIHWLMLSSPAHRAEETSREAFPAWLESKEADTAFDWNDWHRQLEAMLAHDVARAWGGKLDEAAKHVKAKALFVLAEQDHMVNPGTSKVLAKAMGAKVVLLDTPCGHIAPACEATVVRREVREFLEH
jgi:homoserine O-acetyltransferase